MKRLAILGSSGHAAVVIDTAEKQQLYEIVGLVDDLADLSKRVLGYPVLGRDDDFLRLVAEQGIDVAFVAIGDNATRRKVTHSIAARAGLPFATVVHPAAIIAKEVTIGPGTLVAAAAVVGTRTRIGAHCIVNTGTKIDHDCVLDDFASLAPSVTTGGHCRIGPSSAIGIGAVLIHGISIGADSVIGAASLVLSDVPSSVVAYGSPARSVRPRIHGDPYL